MKPIVALRFGICVITLVGLAAYLAFKVAAVCALATVLSIGGTIKEKLSW